MQTNKVMALDVGAVRIGLALASSEARLPSPFRTIIRDDSCIKVIRQLIEENNVGTIVIGLPRNLEGNSTSQTDEITRFATQLKQVVSVPIIFQDEALTSIKAKQELIDRGKDY